MTSGGIPPDSAPPGDCRAETGPADWPGNERAPFGILCTRHSAGATPPPPILSRPVGRPYSAADWRHHTRRAKARRQEPSLCWPANRQAGRAPGQAIAWPGHSHRRIVPTIVGTRYRAFNSRHRSARPLLGAIQPARRSAGRVHRRLLKGRRIIPPSAIADGGCSTTARLYRAANRRHHSGRRPCENDAGAVVLRGLSCCPASCSASVTLEHSVS